jgi:hypothetical protein
MARLSLRNGVLDAGVGVLATVPMSAVMLVGQRLGWMQKQPPEHVVEEALDRTSRDVDGKRAEMAGVLAHIAVGALGGTAYGQLRRSFPSVPSIGFAVAFAIGMWALSYRGWMPAVGTLPAEQRGARATVVMIAAHVAYGAALGALADRRGR